MCVTTSSQFISLDSLPFLLPPFTVPVSSAGLHNMGGDPVPVIHEIRDLLDIGRDRKNPREDYLGEFYLPRPSTLLSQLPRPPQGLGPHSPLFSLRHLCVWGWASGEPREHQCFGFQEGWRATRVQSQGHGKSGGCLLSNAW